MDSVGEFLIRGRYDLKSGEVNFHNHYIGRHSVYYRGFAEGKGIWGTWEMSLRSGFTDRGGFHIWPKGVGNPIGEELAEEVEVAGEVEERVLVEEVPSEEALYSAEIEPFLPSNVRMNADRFWKAGEFELCCRISKPFPFGLCALA